MLNLPLATASVALSLFLPNTDPMSSPEDHEISTVGPLRYLFNSYLKNESWYLYHEEDLDNPNPAAAHFVENLPPWEDSTLKTSISSDGLLHTAFVAETPTHKIVHVGYCGNMLQGPCSLWFFQPKEEED